MPLQHCDGFARSASLGVSASQGRPEDRHAPTKPLPGFPAVPTMPTTLLQLMEELLQNIEQRDAGDPDAPAWEACARISRLEEELARRLAEADARSSTPEPVGTVGGRAGEAVAGIF